MIKPCNKFGFLNEGAWVDYGSKWIVVSPLDGRGGTPTNLKHSSQVTMLSENKKLHNIHKWTPPYFNVFVSLSTQVGIPNLKWLLLPEGSNDGGPMEWSRRCWETARLWKYASNELHKPVRNSPATTICSKSSLLHKPEPTDRPTIRSLLHCAQLMPIDHH